MSENQNPNAYVPPVPPVQPAKPKAAAWVGLVVGGVALLCCGGAATAAVKTFNDGGKPHNVELRVTGRNGATAADVTWSVGAKGSQQASKTEIPWSTTGTQKGGTVISVVAQSVTNDPGAISCTILVDGKSIQSNESVGTYAVVTCTATV